ncbi:MAG: extracellular solute-binding protein [Nitrososphaeraceae archaeon]
MNILYINKKMVFILSSAFLISVIFTGLANSLAAQKEQVTLTAIVAEPKERWDVLFDNASKKLNENHPDMDIKIDYRVLPYDATRTQILTSMAGRTPIDLISVDQIWLGEFAEGGFLTDLTQNATSWGREGDWYPVNWEGGKYEDKIYGIWAWTDVRALWYWKDLLRDAGVDPSTLETWNGYLSAAQKLNDALGQQGIQGAHLVGASHSPDMLYPYLWMLGGDILEQRSGHPTKGTYWFPAYNSTEGAQSLEFIKRQVDAGIKPQVNHFWGQEFADKKFAMMLEGSWLLGTFPREQWAGLNQSVGMIPMFPVPNEGNKSATMMGGWVLSIPQTSQNKDLSWELLTLLVDPEILTTMLEKEGYLPTQKPIAEGSYSQSLNATIPYYSDMISMIPVGHSRPNIPEYPQISDNIREAIDGVYFGGKDPVQALQESAIKTAEVLGW